MKTKELIFSLEKKKDELIRDFEENYKSLTNTIELLKKELEKKVEVDVLETQSIPYIDSENDFIRGKNIGESIRNLITTKKRFLHNKEITDMLLLKYQYRGRKKFSRQISSILSKLKKENKIVSFREGLSQKNVYWGLEEWLDKNNEILIGYEFQIFT